MKLTLNRSKTLHTITVPHNRTHTDRLRDSILHRFPGMPVTDAAQCARRASSAGGSASAAWCGESHILALVVAHARHNYTRYDALLVDGLPRETARARVQDAVEVRLRRWRVARVDRDAAAWGRRLAAAISRDFPVMPESDVICCARRQDREEHGDDFTTEAVRSVVRDYALRFCTAWGSASGSGLPADELAEAHALADGYLAAWGGRAVALAA